MAKNKKNTLTVFEHQLVKVNETINGFTFTWKLFKAMQEFYGEKGVPYFSLYNKSVKFCEYVGVIQIGKTTIEVLPKADRHEDTAQWRESLIDMIRSVGIFDIKAPTSSSLKVKHNSILDLYIELYVIEIESLLRHGLIKKYRKSDHNCPALKGNILFAQHIQKNIVHQELFFTRRTIYDVQHNLHQIFHKVLCLLYQINTNTDLQSRLGNLMLNFPEQRDIKTTEATFQKIVLNRKTEGYRTALEIARLLLLNYHPNVNVGQNNVLALMFDMNMLWEKFVFVSLKERFRKHDKTMVVTAQTSKYFWKPTTGARSSIRPDIVINYGLDNESCVVIDTKWKNLNGYNPSPEDLRQLYVYHEFYDAKRVTLIYPGSFATIKGLYYTKSHNLGNKECSVMGIKVVTNILKWREEIGNNVLNWITSL